MNSFEGSPKGGPAEEHRKQNLKSVTDVRDVVKSERRSEKRFRSRKAFEYDF